jgi:hypothetical protein
MNKPLAEVLNWLKKKVLKRFCLSEFRLFIGARV